MVLFEFFSVAGRIERRVKVCVCVQETDHSEYINLSTKTIRCLYLFVCGVE